ncbi:MAG: IS66 family transposase [Eubacteriales bacterium]|nr:IS66 family transposase [Eubacteriales bacterium]
MKRKPVDKDMRIAQLEDEVKRLQAMIDTLTAVNLQLHASIESLNGTILELNQTIRELKEKINKNSRNSSRPPSSDGMDKPPRQRSLRTSSGKPQGGQKDHPGASLKIDTSKPDKVVDHVASGCELCPHREKCRAEADITDRHYVVDIEFRKTLVCHQTIRMRSCLLDHTELEGRFPQGAKAPVQYGNMLTAFAVTLNTVGAMSISRINAVLSDAFDLPVSTGIIPVMVHKCAEGLKDTVNSIRALVIGSLVVNFDEAGVRVNGHNKWIHTACTEKYTYLSYNQNRGWKGMTEAGVLNVFAGIAVHDCWKPYWKFEGVIHAVCNAHLLRELNGIKENNPSQTWAGKFQDLLLEMLKTVKRMREKGRDAISRYYHRKFDAKYDELMKLAHEENPYPDPPPEKKRGRKKKGKILALIERLEKYKASVCLFTKNFNVPFDNNQAERSFRHVRTKTKVSGCFRTEAGVCDYVTIMSYVGTAQKHGKNAFNAILCAVSGVPESIFSA